MSRYAPLLVVFLVGAGCAAAGESEKASPKAPDDGVAARVGGKTITLEEVDRKAMAGNLQAFQALYDARRAALEEIIADHLLSREAEKRGVTQEALVAEEITGKAKPVADPDIDNFYNQNRARMGGQTLDQVKERIRQFLEVQNLQEARRTFLDGLKKQTELAITLDPPRLEVTVASNDPVRGPDTARVTIVEFSDFQ